MNVDGKTFTLIISLNFIPVDVFSHDAFLRKPRASSGEAVHESGGFQMLITLCMFASQTCTVPGSELLLTLARKNGKKKGGGKKKKTTSRRSLTCARQPRRARQPYTRADQ